MAIPAPLLSVVIVNYNVRYFLEQTLHSVMAASKNMPVEVFVVDNNSKDESCEMVRREFPFVILIENKDNPGFSIANNQAIRQSKGKYVLLLNPDTVVAEDTFDKVIEFMEGKENAGALGIKMVDGSGVYLPESKRGFPSPWVAFCKTVGLANFFPKSRLFNHYYLGHLSDAENNKIEVLAGAFMLFKRKVLEEVGLLDEAFFMYGEDIDLSYRVIKGGYENYYFGESPIIHYKGESTKKGSLNYVKAFYQAMIIFAKKHFEGGSGKLFVEFLKLAIYFRASITVVSAVFRAIFLPLLEAIFIFIGLYFIKSFWETTVFDNENYFPVSMLWVNFPLYIGVWLSFVWLNGGYDAPRDGFRLGRGLLMGTVILLAIYGLLDMEYRSSRAVLVLGSVWAMLSSSILRWFLQIRAQGSWELREGLLKNVAIVGNKEDEEKVLEIIRRANVSINYIGLVSVEDVEAGDYLGQVRDLENLVKLFRVDELIFCTGTITNKEVIAKMLAIGSLVSYKIVPPRMDVIIGSSDKNTSGELYTMNIEFRILEPIARRNKRLVDILVSMGVCFLFPFVFFVFKQPFGALQNALLVFVGRKTWVGYGSLGSKEGLPKIREGVLPPYIVFGDELEDRLVQRLQFFYAKDYSAWRDLEYILRGFRNLGDK